MKNAIVVLTRGYSNLNQYSNLIKRNILIYENICKKLQNQFDIVIFHEGNITKEQQDYIKSKTPLMGLIFQNVKDFSNRKAFDDTKNIINYDLCPPTSLSNGFPLGYKHMCHFWSIDFLFYLENYEYIIRIDEDCFVYDFDEKLLDFMKKNQIQYISPKFQEQDHPQVIVGMKKMWEKYLYENKIKVTTKFEDIKCPYTNLFIMNLNFFRNNESILNFLNYIDECGGIYSNRWGDLPIWGLILTTFVDSSNYSDSTKIVYHHLSHNVKIN
jgi:hypothetical protein